MFTSTNQPKNKGRKKKIYTILKEKGYSLDDTRAAFSELGYYTEEEINEVLADDDKPMIMRIVANQYKLALDKGDWSRIKEILEHVIGKPQQVIEHQGEILTREERLSRIKELSGYITVD